jgi:hypothetical protein
MYVFLVILTINRDYFCNNLNRVVILMDTDYIVCEVRRTLFFYVIWVHIRFQIFKIIVPCTLCHSHKWPHLFLFLNYKFE